MELGGGGKRRAVGGQSSGEMYGGEMYLPSAAKSRKKVDGGEPGREVSERSEVSVETKTRKRG